VGLDTPASCINILNALQTAGYAVENIPADGDRLIELLTSGITNDPESEANQIYQSIAASDYQKFFDRLPQSLQTKVINRWGEPPAQGSIKFPAFNSAIYFIGIQPARGYDQDPSLNYHSPDLEPPHEYFGFYFWLKQIFNADAIVHVGKHGNLEWLPVRRSPYLKIVSPKRSWAQCPIYIPLLSTILAKAPRQNAAPRR
jgi:cobaltochelatase CobN